MAKKRRLKPQRRPDPERQLAEALGEMANALLQQGHVPLMLVGGKELGGGYRDYTVAGMPGMEEEYMRYVIGRLNYILSGQSKTDAESN